ncbi:MAG: N-6 DNA methylase [Lachnospiraceae bacterium]|nr:N-6 DNA methylase [Lachnospiraceae bacterium]
MINRQNIEEAIKTMGFISSSPKKYEKYYEAFSCSIILDLDSEKIIYPEEAGLTVTHRSTCNFSNPENFVVLECVNRLLEKGYRPEHIELEREWLLGHEGKSGRADICVSDEDENLLFIIECKTPGNEYAKEKKNMLTNGGQLFSYWQQDKSCKWLALYASDLDDGKLTYDTDSIDCTDDANIIASAKNDPTIRLYLYAHTTAELFNTWDETYEKRFCGDIIFRDDSVAYNIGVKPLRKSDLKDFSENDRIVNRFEEILRHNNVSDKENAFNRLVALFICKLVDEMQKSDHDIVEFQYKVGTDTYESLQDRLQRLYKEGMEKFMREKILYVPDDYAENLVQQYTGQRRQKMIQDLRDTLRILKFYTNNDFSFIDIHNEDLFYQNGKILVEVVQLFQEYRIIGSADVQMLGDLFEQLLNKGFKQNEGQFFTPIPITRFIWDSLPLESIVRNSDGMECPKIVDYACGAGHFLTQGCEAVNNIVKKIDPEIKLPDAWVENKVYGIEKDYRLARVSKISLFMHGAGGGNIIFGDGLENYPDKNITPYSFDILAANPPYSVKAFKQHLKLKDNSLEVLDKISNDGSEIETLFVERISQLLKPLGVAAVILPSSILNKENESFIAAREFLLRNFYIRAIAQFGSKTFGATGTNTVILFLQKFEEPPKHTDLASDSVHAIYEGADITDWEDSAIYHGYLRKIGVTKEVYCHFTNRAKNYDEWKEDSYFGQYYSAFLASSEYGAKIRQKGFIRASVDEQMRWFNQHFYDYAFSLEQEKLLYFALVYRQSTLVVTAPNDNKNQETFLGYKWSNRKGQEGIQIIKAGGLLYNDSDRYDDRTLAGMIRNSFSENIYDVPELEKYYDRLRLQDMLDFSGVSFSKTIKTTRTRVLKDTPGLTNYRLSDTSIFEISIGNRVLSTEITEDGTIPVYSANVFEEFGRIDKQNLTDFSIPSILWGIDGDWMVNIIPANQPFYPTDHCGVLRIHSDKIMPEYMALALQVEGEFEKFSRHNRASAQRVANLVIQVPPKDEQKAIVKEINSLKQKLKKATAEDNKTKIAILKSENERLITTYFR